MLTGKNIYKRYGTVEVLKGVNIEIKGRSGFHCRSFGFGQKYIAAYPGYIG